MVIRISLARCGIVFGSGGGARFDGNGDHGFGSDGGGMVVVLVATTVMVMVRFGGDGLSRWW